MTAIYYIIVIRYIKLYFQSTYSDFKVMYKEKFHMKIHRSSLKMTLFLYVLVQNVLSNVLHLNNVNLERG